MKKKVKSDTSCVLSTFLHDSQFQIFFERKGKKFVSFLIEVSLNL